MRVERKAIRNSYEFHKGRGNDENRKILMQEICDETFNNPFALTKLWVSTFYSPLYMLYPQYTYSTIPSLIPVSHTSQTYLYHIPSFGVKRINRKHFLIKLSKFRLFKFAAKVKENILIPQFTWRTMNIYRQRTGFQREVSL